MKRALVVLAACSETTALEPWQLDHDRVVAVRSEPPHIAPGEVALVDALIAHRDGPTTIEAPVNVAAKNAPGDLFAAVHFNLDHWEIDGPDAARLDAARAELGLPADAPVPLALTIELPGPLYAQKTVWLGDARSNPAPPALSHGPDLELGRAYTLEVTAPVAGTVRWLTSCGELRDATERRATHVVDEACDGELVVVARDADGGVAWLVLPVHSR